MLKTISISTPWSSSDSGNLGKGSDNVLDGGDEEELGEPDGSATMTLSQLTRKERDKLQGFKMFFRENSRFGLEKTNKML